jgi:hypothetical protein
VPWFCIHLRGVDEGHSWFATNEEEVLENFVRNWQRTPKNLA